jgi:nucleotide-binding universal stress UspA family protein
MFNRLLVPTDLSDHAASAAGYALQLFRRLPGARITFFHANDRYLPTSTPIRLYGQLMADTLKQDRASLEEHIRQVLYTSRLAYQPHRMELHVESGSYLDNVKHVLTRCRPDLVVMGTRGASGLKKYVLGSNTVKTLGLSDCPILAVPDGYTPDAAPHIVYATDMQQLPEETQRVAALTRLLGARLSVVHLYRPHHDQEPAHAYREALLSQLWQLTPHQSASVLLQQVAGPQDLTQLMQRVVAEEKPTLLVMFTRKKSWLEQLLSVSHTEAFLYSSQVPVLAFKRN